MGGFMKEFKEFIARGNVMNMAVGIIIGGAFGAIITALVDNVIGPIIGMAIGGIDFSKLAITVGSAQLMIGAFIQAIINFLITAFVLFCIIKALNKAKAAVEKPAEEEADETPADIALLEEIRDLLKK